MKSSSLSPLSWPRWVRALAFGALFGVVGYGVGGWLAKVAPGGLGLIDKSLRWSDLLAMLVPPGMLNEAIRSFTAFDPPGMPILSAICASWSVMPPGPWVFFIMSCMPAMPPIWVYFCTPFAAANPTATVASVLMKLMCGAPCSRPLADRSAGTVTGFWHRASVLAGSARIACADGL